MTLHIAALDSHTYYGLTDNNLHRYYGDYNVSEDGNEGLIQLRSGCVFNNTVQHEGEYEFYYENEQIFEILELLKAEKCDPQSTELVCPWNADLAEYDHKLLCPNAEDFIVKDDTHSGDNSTACEDGEKGPSVESSLKLEKKDSNVTFTLKIN